MVSDRRSESHMRRVTRQIQSKRPGATAPSVAIHVAD